MGVIRGMDHFTVVTDHLEETLRFYERLGLTDGPRPGFGVPGHWLYSGEVAVLHLIGVGVMPEPRRGAIDHIAFSATGLQATLDSLAAAGTACRIIRTPRPWSYWQVFCLDPNGVEVELCFSADEPKPRPDGGGPPPAAERQ